MKIDLTDNFLYTEKSTINFGIREILLKIFEN